MAQQVKESMLDSAIALFAERGVAATSMADVIAHSGAPRGSLYHYFPGGKSQLAGEAVRRAGAVLARRLVMEERDASPVDALRRMVRLWEDILESSGFGSGCPVLASSLAESAEVSAIAGEVFADWHRVLEHGLVDAGVGRERAASLATMVLASVEGAIVLSRAQRTAIPLKRVGAELESLLAAAVVP